MSTSLLIVSLFAAISTVISVLALIAAWSVQRASGSNSWRKPFASLKAEFADLLAMQDELLESHKRLRSREGMRDLRERRRGAETSERTEHRATGAERRRALGVADNPVAAVLDNLSGKYSPTR